jgi:hypothetical protein
MCNPIRDVSPIEVSGSAGVGPLVAWSLLPPEIVMHVFSSLDFRSLARCSLVCKKWKQLSSAQNLWKDLFVKQVLPYGFRVTSYYARLTFPFVGSQRCEVALAGCEMIPLSHGGDKECVDHVRAESFRDLCKQACLVHEYKFAQECQQKASQYLAEAGSQAMWVLIKTQAEDSDFLEKSEKLLQLARELIKQDREYGLDALIAVAKRFADLKDFTQALKLIEEARTLRDSIPLIERPTSPFDREYHFDRNILPVAEMCKHLVRLGQYELVQECFKNIEKEYFHPEWLPKEMGEVEEENFIKRLLSPELQSGTIPWVMAEKELWENVFTKNDACLLFDLTKRFFDSRRYGGAIAAAETFGFRYLDDICKWACKCQEYDIVLLCLQHAKESYHGGPLMRDIVEKAEGPFVLANSEQLVSLAMDLIKDKRDCGLDTLMAVAKRLADMKDFAGAMKYTQEASQLRESMPGYRAWNSDYDILPYAQMCRHMVGLRQYKFAAECASNIEQEYFHPDWLHFEASDKELKENFAHILLDPKYNLTKMRWVTAEKTVWKPIWDNVVGKMSPECLKKEDGCISEWITHLLYSRRYGAAIALGEKHAELLGAKAGASDFEWMLVIAYSDIYDYPMAVEFHRYAKRYNPTLPDDLDKRAGLAPASSCKISGLVTE